MSILSASEMASVQATMKTSMDQTCVIKRLTLGHDTTGYATDTQTTINTTVARVGLPTGSYMQNLADRMGDLKTWLITLPYGTDVKSSDLLVISGQTFTVQTVFTPNSLNTSVRLLASQLV